MILIGDSHAHGMNRAFRLLSEEDKTAFEKKYGKFQAAMLMPARFFTTTKYFSIKENKIYFDKTNRAYKNFTENTGKSAIEKNDENNYLFSIGFHNVMLILREKWSKLTINKSAGKSTGKQFITSRTFIEMVRYFNRYNFMFFENLQEFSVDFKVLASPPPQKTFYYDYREDHLTLKNHLTLDEYLDVTLTYRDIYMDELKTRGIEFVEPLSETIDGGFLLDEFSSGKEKDFHTNDKYREKLLLKLLNM